ncbi:peptidase (PNG1) [Aspergillus ustus]|uniref:Peptidase (PNG1) n=1 Tax=Aspergillus ustus TaxID=40382 RepID=A0A0C1BWI9_ASPUT|nr:peptidase (PNG1) [Aspergillus ustus]
MRGRTAETARPYLVFSSEDEERRKTACQRVKDSNILKKFPTVKTTHARYPPEMRTWLQLLGDQVLGRGPGAESHTHIVDQDIYYKLSGSSMARELFIGRLLAVRPGRRATAGGIICVGNRSFYLTVYHVLEQEEHQQLLHDNELRNPINIGGSNGEQIEADYEEESEEEDEESEGEGEEFDDSGFEDGSPITSVAMTTTSYGDNGASETTEQLSERPQHGYKIDFSNLNEDLFITAQPPLRSSTTQPSHLAFTRLSSSAAIGRRSLDYLLIEIHQDDKEKINRFIAPQTVSHTVHVHEVASVGHQIQKVTIVSGCHGISSGSLFPTPRFIRLPKANNTQKIFSLKLDRYVQPGDCGSWVIDEASGSLYGHIFGGGVGTKTAYIIPADEIFEDIRQISRQPVFLPAAKDERQVISKKNSQPTLSRSLQLDPPQANETASKNLAHPAVPGGVKDRYQHPLRNIFDRALNTVLQVPSSRSQNLNATSNEASKIPASKNIAYPAVSGDVKDRYQHPLRNIFDRTFNDVHRVPSSRSQNMKTTSNEASKIRVNCLGPNQADLSLKTSPERSDVGRAATCLESSPPKEFKSSATDDDTSCWSYKPESSPSVFNYSP